jgi:hypothetical protein
VGCALLEPSQPTSLGPAHKIIFGDYDEIWRAIQKALVNYPIQINNSDQGIIETDIIKGEQIWHAPHIKQKEKRNPRYVIRVNVVKGTSKNKSSSRVSVTKSISLEKDFFSGTERLPSDGLEERAIIYRIERELNIERSLRRAFERGM